MPKNTVKAIPLQAIDSSEFDGSTYIEFGPLPETCVSLRISNTSGVLVTISFDQASVAEGKTDHDLVGAGTARIYAIQPWRSEYQEELVWPKGLVIAVKGNNSSGNVSLSGFYVPK